MKKIVFWILYILFCFVFFCVSAEILFRVFRKADQPELYKITQKQRDFLLTPGVSVEGISSIPGEFSYTAKINQFGYRGKDFAMPKPDGALRILAVGDSFTFGVGAEDSQTIPALLESKLRKLEFNAEVINAGVGHAGVIQHYMNLRDLHLKYDPDLVVLFLDMTDIMDDWHSERNGVFDKDGEIRAVDETYVNGRRDWWRVVMRHSAFARWFHNKIVRAVLKIHDLGLKDYVWAKLSGQRAKALIISENRARSEEDVLAYDSLLMLRGSEQKELIEKQWARSGRYLLKIRDMLTERNIPLVLVVYPHGIYVGETQWNEGRKTWGFEQNKRYTDYFPFELVEEFARKNHIPFINTLDAFLLAEDKPYFYDWDGHMTPAGYEIVAQTVVLNPAFQQKLR